MSLERIYTVSLSKIYSIGRHRVRARKAVKYIKAFTKRHMKVSEEDIIFGQDLNEHIWMNGIEKPPKKIKIKMFKDDTGKVKLNLDAPVVKKDKKEKKEIKKSNPKTKSKKTTTSTTKKTKTTTKKVEKKEKE
ncbi:MAG: 50S ribosomal protein L31e [archaeon]|jgi:large subunit ribosomal protein L31e|nr:60S ribosomal protein L31 [Bacteroidales bacterium]